MEGTNHGADGDVKQELHNNAPLPLLSHTNQNQVDPNQRLGVGNNMMDPKKLKRVAASREYSQRSRLKQLHHITHLESEVKFLQANNAATFQKIKYVEAQNSLFRAENDSMELNLYAKGGELTSKEVEYHELKEEKDKLNQLSFLKQSPYPESYKRPYTY